MNPQRSESFEDARLKQAVQRAWGDEQTPKTLRARVERLLVDVAKPARFQRRNPLYGLAAAAMVLLVAGIFAYRFMDSRSNPNDAYGVLPATLAQAMVFTHDRCCKHTNHHTLQGVPRDNFTLINQTLESKLGRPVLAADLSDSNWNFRGASICMVDRTQAAHLVFVKGTQTLSIFSLPASLCRGAGRNEDYETSVHNHPIAGFVKDEGLYCLVGHSPEGELKLKDVETMRDQLKGRFAVITTRTTSVASVR